MVATELKSSILTAKQWLQTCETSHEKCKQTRSTRLPTRVIDVGKLGQTGLTADPVLYKSHGEEVRYVALSHCWGKVPIIRTMRATILANYKGIEWASLSRTFQDAIIITRMLGIRYLWIDSLCIIQDDTDDWRREAAQMASIYGEAYLTISASNSIDGNGGCYCTPYPTFEAGQVFPPDDNTSFTVYAREKPVHNRFRYWARPGSVGMEKDGFDTYPLLTRAWCFQERLLPTRILHFTSQEMFFECKTGDRCECINFDPRPFADVRKPLKHEFFDTLARRSEEELLKEWIGILEAYTHMGRTQDGDILVALAGIARVMSEAGLQNYCAGMWQSNLRHALNWKPKRDENEQHRRPDVYTAPSFSWASVIGPIEWDHSNSWSINTVKKYCPEFLDFTPTLTGTDLFGGLSAASLKVRAPLAHANVYSNHNEGVSDLRFKIYGLPDFDHDNLQFDVPESCADAIASTSIYLMQTEALINEVDETRSQTNTMILIRRDDGTYERLGVAENLQLGVFEDQYGPCTEITLV